jgi:hypothetical protein
MQLPLSRPSRVPVAQIFTWRRVQRFQCSARLIPLRYSDSMDDPTPPAIVNDAITALLAVVARSAADLRRFHDVVSKARIGPLPPFPRETVLTTERIVNDLRRVEEDLRQLLVALGLGGRDER